MSPRGTNVEHGPIELVWEAPPEPTSRTLGDYEQVLKEVKDHPGQWARIRVFTTQNAYTVRKNLIAAYREDRWEFKIVITKPKAETETETWTLYARYRSPEQMQAARRNGG